MFTGIIEDVGEIRRIEKVGDSARLWLTTHLDISTLKLGDSIAVDGLCLTVTEVQGNSFRADVSSESLNLSTLKELHPGKKVNLELALRADGRLGGHFVLGHVDGIGTVIGFDRRPGTGTLVIRATQEVMRCVVPKGSIAVDGISLTVASCSEDEFRVAVIPHTIENTNLASRRPGDSVNLEADILGKYVERFLSGRSSGGGVTAQLLAEAGWLEE